MYEEFFHLSDKPFTKTPDPRFLYKSAHHAEALARLQYAVEERELAVLTGDIGSGKTLLSRALMDSLTDAHPVALIVNPRLTPLQLLRTVALKFGVESPREDKADLLDQIYGSLADHDDRGQCPVLIVDEAQLIEEGGTYDEIRLLTNYQRDDKNLLSLIMIGQPELKERLMTPALRALRQRIGIHYHLTPLTLEETKEYIAYRLKVSGREDPLFTDDALAMIHRLSRGIPREINNLCAASLLEGYGQDAPRVGADIVRSVGADLGYSLLAAGGGRRRRASGRRKKKNPPAKRRIRRRRPVSPSRGAKARRAGRRRAR